ncbi:hypothetical protein B0A50_02082 [Salinomyces thailandicus]|uniref:Uncharacterized protein n=1 Tax=Salinomyces thailandicus TaxID=706561 RepID=A0A4U0U7B4_9PEZI|nr:hypothetical protein B0A50_02082 [Salinomyces thailandica]
MPGDTSASTQARDSLDLAHEHLDHQNPDGSVKTPHRKHPREIPVPQPFYPSRSCNWDTLTCKTRDSLDLTSLPRYSTEARKAERGGTLGTRAVLQIPEAAHTVPRRAAAVLANGVDVEKVVPESVVLSLAGSETSSRLQKDPPNAAATTTRLTRRGKFVALLGLVGFCLAAAGICYALARSEAQGATFGCGRDLAGPGCAVRVAGTKSRWLQRVGRGMMERWMGGACTWEEGCGEWVCRGRQGEWAPGVFVARCDDPSSEEGEENGGCVGVGVGMD